MGKLLSVPAPGRGLQTFPALFEGRFEGEPHAENSAGAAELLTEGF